jgi:ribonuclease PH
VDNVRRLDGRSASELRPVRITPHFLSHPAGSCLIEIGGTRVVCSTMVEDTVPRVNRERSKMGGRTQEIQRLIGRSLRTAVDLSAIGERTILIDCDVLDADGGTRTAAITGAYVSLVLALRKLEGKNPKFRGAIKTEVAAISVGIVHGILCLDLPYEEDKVAEVDMNVVKTSGNQYIEIQGTAEAAAFGREAMNQMLDLADGGIQQLFQAQKKALES